MSLRPPPNKTKNEDVEVSKPVDLFPISKLSDRLSVVLSIGMQRSQDDFRFAPSNRNPLEYDYFGEFDRNPFPDVFEAKMTDIVKGIYQDIVKRVKKNPDQFVFTSLGQDRYGKPYPILDLGYKKIPEETFAAARSFWINSLKKIWPGFEVYVPEQFIFSSTENASVVDDIVQQVVPFNLSDNFRYFVGFKRVESVEHFAERLIITALAVHRDVAPPMVAAFHQSNPKYASEIISTFIFRAPRSDLQDVIEEAINGPVSDPGNEMRIRSENYVKISFAMIDLLERLREGGFWIATGWGLERIEAVPMKVDRIDTLKLYLFDFNPATSRVWEIFEASDCSILLHAMILVLEIFLDFKKEAKDLIDTFLLYFGQTNYGKQCMEALEELRDTMYVRQQAFEEAQFIAKVTKVVKNRASAFFAQRQYKDEYENVIIGEISKFITEELKIGEATSYYKRRKSQ